MSLGHIKSIVALMQQRGDVAPASADSATDSPPDRIAQDLSFAFPIALGDDNKASSDATRYFDLMASDSR